ncbi:MAG: hypothetical protein J6Q51_02670 [Clostridia bacterium]|nr:hypothetical protein [Clostridia bacterium]
MGYNSKKLAQELVEKGMADNGLIAWGQNSSGLLGAVGAIIAPMHVISKVGNLIVVTPFSNKQIFFEKAIAYKKENMINAKLKGGLFGASLKLEMKSGKTYKYSIIQGKAELKQMLKELGF